MLISISTENHHTTGRKLTGIFLFIFYHKLRSGKDKTQGWQCDIWDFIIRSINEQIVLYMRKLSILSMSLSLLAPYVIWITVKTEIIYARALKRINNKLIKCVIRA